MPRVSRSRGRRRLSRSRLARGLTRAERRSLAHASRLALSIEGVTGVDFGVAYREGRPTGKLAVRFHVARKRTKVPADQRLPARVHDIPCDVVQAVYQCHGGTATDSLDPIRPGISIGNSLRGSNGTLGAIVFDGETTAPCLLSNWHVLSASLDAAPGEAITQPGPRHPGARRVGQLLRSTDLDHGLDAAVAQLDKKVKLDPRVLGLDRELAGVAEAAFGMNLVKCGVATGLTHGIVDGTGAYLIDYSPFGDGLRWMDGVRITIDFDAPDDEISLRGDSGSVWLDPATNEAVALSFAGEDNVGPSAEYALAHPLSPVLERLGVRL
jgi:endonuclease G